MSSSFSKNLWVFKHVKMFCQRAASFNKIPVSKKHFLALTTNNFSTDFLNRINLYVTNFISIPKNNECRSLIYSPCLLSHLLATPKTQLHSDRCPLAPLNIVFGSKSRIEVRSYCHQPQLYAFSTSQREQVTEFSGQLAFSIGHSGYFRINYWSRRGRPLFGGTPGSIGFDSLSWRNRGAREESASFHLIRNCHISWFRNFRMQPNLHIFELSAFVLKWGPGCVWDKWWTTFAVVCLHN